MISSRHGGLGGGKRVEVDGLLALEFVPTISMPDSGVACCWLSCQLSILPSLEL